MGDAELQVLQDALHGVVGLLLGSAQVLLHSAGHGGEDGLGCFPRVHDLSRVLLVLLLQPLDVGEGFLHSHHQPVEGRDPQDGTMTWPARPTGDIGTDAGCPGGELQGTTGPSLPSLVACPHLPYLARRFRTRRSCSASS